MNYYDVCCYLHKDPQCQIKELNEYGITRAILSSADGERLLNQSNNMLLKAIEDIDGYYAAVTICPQDINEGLCERLLSYKKRKCKALRIYPHSHNADIKDYGELFNLAAEMKLLLIIEHTQCSFRQLDCIFSKHNKLRGLVDGSDKKLLYHCENIYRLLERHENIYFETHHLNQYGMLDSIVKKHRADRVLFGSYYPYYSPNSSIGLIESLDVNASIKQIISTSKGFDFYDEN